MINKLICLLLILTFSFKLQALTLDFNNKKINFKTNIYMLRNKNNFLKKNSKYPKINFVFNGVNNINYYLDIFTTVDLSLDINHYIINKDIKCIKPKIYFLGLRDKKYGKLSFGKNYGVIYNIDRYIENSPMIRLNTKPINYMLYKSDNVLTYKNSNFFNLIKNLDIYLQKQFEKKEDKNMPLCLSTKLSNGDGYGFSIEYKINSFLNVAGAYSSSKRTIDQIIFDLTNVDDNARAYSLGFKVDTNKLYISSVYGQTYNITPYGNFLISPKPCKGKKYESRKEPLFYGFSNYSKNAGLVLQYKFNNSLIPSIGYFQSKVFMFRTVNNHDIAKYIELGLNYNLKCVSTYFNYKINLMKPDYFLENANISCRNLFNMGFNLKF